MAKVTFAQVTFEEAMDRYYEAQLAFEQRVLDFTERELAMGEESLEDAFVDGYHEAYWCGWRMV